MFFSKLTSLWHFFERKSVLYTLGIVLTLAISILEASRGRALNFYIYSEATLDFLGGLNPFVGWSERHTLDVFLYLPPFNTLFTPFALLPQWLGAIVWNLLNFNLLFLAISAVCRLRGKTMRFMMLYVILVMAQALFSFQYNITIAYIFLFSFILLERGQYWWALLLIVISGATKVYGFFELALFVCYPQFWRNVGRGVLLLVAVLLLPALTVGFVGGIAQLYEGWFTAINVHSYRPFETMTRLILVYTHIDTYDIGNLIFAIVALALTMAIIFMRKRFRTTEQRAQLLGIIMVTIILWGTNSERNTYIIAILGHALWYINTERHNMLDKILIASNFILITLIPIDILCPRAVLNLLMNGLVLNVLSMLVTWIRMLYVTFAEGQRTYLAMASRHTR